MALDPVLTTKLSFPPQRPNILTRPRLTVELSKRLACSLTLISAPAGFGKTTLISDWLRGLDRSSTWLSLDEGDNDPVRFFTYLVAALQKVDSRIGRNLLGALHTVPLPPVEALLSVLIGEIEAIAYPFILVLDDFHVITLPAIQDAIAFLLDHKPSQLHLVLISRTDPLFPLSRLRARGELHHLRAADLCFTQEEATIFLNKISGLNLTPEQIGDLEARTEGWIAGLQLVMLSMQSRRDSASFIADFTGSHRYITDYLMEEVMRGQPEEIQDFLLQTCLLDRLSGPLCNAVLSAGARQHGSTGDHSFSPAPLHPRPPVNNSQDILEYLDRANLFILPLDEVRQWYRYHHLFSDVLRNRLRQVYPERIPEIHHKAAEWYKENGFFEEALNHTLVAGDFDWAAQMVEQNARTLLMFGEILTLINMTEKIPCEAIRAHPWLSTHYGTALMLTGQIQAAESAFQDAEQNIIEGDPSQRRHIFGDIAAMRANISARSGNVIRTIELARQALENLPPEDLTVRSVVAYVLGNAYILNRDCSAAYKIYQDAARMSQEAGNYYLAVAATCGLARVRAIQGKLHQAYNFFMQAEQIAAEQRQNQSRMMDYGYAWLADLLRERNELQAARGILVDHIKHCEQWRSTDAIVISSVVLARTLLALGNLDEALDLLQNTQVMTQGYLIDLTNISQLYACQIIVWIAAENLPEADRCLEDWQNSQRHLPNYLSDLQKLAHIRLLIAANKNAEVLELILLMESEARTGCLYGTLIEILVLKSLALRYQKDLPGALTALEEALTIAGPEGYVRVFADEGHPLAELLLQLRRRVPGLRNIIDKILKAMTSVPSASHLQIGAPVPSLLIEPLTGREVEVLKLIAAGCTNQEIAAKLVIEVNTTKRHLSNIYAKLGVQNRTQAVVRSRELGLLE